MDITPTAYLKTLSSDEMKVIQIANKCLESSFDISKSVGYQKWLKENS
jgi:hypothetical protein